MQKIIRFFSPALLSSIFLLIVILSALLEMHQSQGWSLIVVLIFLPAFLVLLLTTLALRFFFRVSTQKLWMTELAVLLLMALVYALFIF